MSRRWWCALWLLLPLATWGGAWGGRARAQRQTEPQTERQTEAPFKKPAPAPRARSSSLSWVRAPGAETCISTQALARKVEAHIGPVFVPPAEAELSIEGLVARQPEPEGFVVRVAVSDERGQPLGSRELRARGADCRVLDEATALIVALAIDREAAFARLPRSLISGLDPEQDPAALLLAELEESPPAPAPAAPAASPAPAAPPKYVAAAEAPREDGGPGSQPLELELGLSLGLLVLTERALGPELALGHRSKPLGFPAKLRVRYWLPREIDIANGVVSMSLAQASLIGCPLEFLDDWRLHGCLGLFGGVLFASGSGFASENQTLRDVWGTSLELQAAAPLSAGLEVALGFSGQFSFNPHRVLAPAGPFDTLVEVYRSERMALAVDLGLVFAL